MTAPAQPSLFGFHCPLCGCPLPYATEDTTCFQCEIESEQDRFATEVAEGSKGEAA